MLERFLERQGLPRKSVPCPCPARAASSLLYLALQFSEAPRIWPHQNRGRQDQETEKGRDQRPGSSPRAARRGGPQRQRVETRPEGPPGTVRGLAPAGTAIMATRSDPTLRSQRERTTRGVKSARELPRRWGRGPAATLPSGPRRTAVSHPMKATRKTSKRSAPREGSLPAYRAWTVTSAPEAEAYRPRLVAELDLVASRSQRDGAQRVVRPPDRLVGPVHARPPAGKPGVGQHEVGRRLGLRLEADQVGTMLSYGDAMSAARRAVERKAGACTAKGSTKRASAAEASGCRSAHAVTRRIAAPTGARAPARTARRPAPRRSSGGLPYPEQPPLALVRNRSSSTP